MNHKMTHNLVSKPGWVTNDSEVAEYLRAADRLYDRAINASRGLCLSDKINAIRKAREDRQRSYSAILNGIKAEVI